MFISSNILDLKIRPLILKKIPLLLSMKAPRSAHFGNGCSTRRPSAPLGGCSPACLTPQRGQRGCRAASPRRLPDESPRTRAREDSARSQDGYTPRLAPQPGSCSPAALLRTTLLLASSLPTLILPHPMQPRPSHSNLSSSGLPRSVIPRPISSYRVPSYLISSYHIPSNPDPSHPVSPNTISFRRVPSYLVTSHFVSALPILFHPLLPTLSRFVSFHSRDLPRSILCSFVSFHSVPIFLVPFRPDLSQFLSHSVLTCSILSLPFSLPPLPCLTQSASPLSAPPRSVPPRSAPPRPIEPRPSPSAQAHCGVMRSRLSIRVTYWLAH